MTDLLVLAGRAARTIHPRYAAYVDREDVEQEVALYAVGRGKTHLEKLIAADDEPYALRALHGVAKQFCEREKAARSGYDIDDVAWYSPEKIDGLLQIALDPEWDGLTGDADESEGGGNRQAVGREGGTLLAMVADVRRALEARPEARFALSSANTDVRRQALESLSEFLGGEFPTAPAYRRRRVLSNAAAIAATRESA